ncbi:hypothetical protein SELSPUOL_02675 [Selenomonas sputigena ATCC 35185]|uniref:Uncharacterized protein n=1 Tax=Selenomonas sputigena (strain ATCC 35185 / DSM 20758 / CCUG 44933 / VPI D19B-28) TaxID=546271 RepID=C9LYW3_SELS3|nr:hypothetical protein SELSPUOL_02675 [Selenomonas sputigena ATCC 35185]
MLAKVHKFQSTRPRGARRFGVVADDTDAVFQSTRPRGARPQFERHRWRRAGFQSTRPRGARLSR